MMTTEELYERISHETAALRQDIYSTLGMRLSRVELEIYGDGKGDDGIKARLNKISETIIGQRWHGYALITLVVLEMLSFVLIALLFVKVY